MITAFNIILLLIIVISFMGAIADNYNDRVMSMASICIASMVAFIVSVMWL